MAVSHEISRLDEAPPVRRIGTNRRSLTGKIVTRGRSVAFESALERDFILMMDWDRDVLRISEQPFKVPYTDGRGRKREYTPDFLVRYDTGEWGLYEVKYRADIRENWRLLKPKFKGALRHAKENGMRFSIMTEIEIRTPYLQNINFLRRYRYLERDPDIEEHLINTLAMLGETTPEALLKAAYRTTENRMKALSSLWKLIGIGRVHADLYMPFTMKSPIWVIIGEGFLCKHPHS